MKTARNREEFEKFLKEGKPFHFEPKGNIMIADLGEGEPIVKVQGEINENRALVLLTYALGATALNMIGNGQKVEDVISECTDAYASILDVIEEAAKNK